MTRNIHDGVIVVTGASSGIGAATAVACARAGMDCVLNGRDAERLSQVAVRVRALGRSAETVNGDVTEPGLNARLLDVAQERFGRFDVVFANAGYGYKKPTHELAEAELRAIFEVNFFAATALVCEAARRLIAQRRPGHLLMCSSAVAKFTLINFAAYSATKAAQNHVCRAMRMELRPHRIEVASVHPITTRTAFFVQAAQRAGRDLDPQHPYGDTPAWLLQDADQVANAVVRCLRRPTPEVWTSAAARWWAGIMTVFPRILDRFGRHG